MIDDMDDTSEGQLTASELDKIGAKWIDRINAADDREEIWLKAAERAETAYLCDTSKDAEGHVPEFNILHSNVETIVPAIYNSVPEPDIRPRNNAKDPAARELAGAFERAISTQIDDDKLTPEIEALAQDSVLAGRGITRVRFDADTSGQSVTGETVRFENVSWRDYREGPAKRWEAVPWVAYRHCLSQRQVDELQDDDIKAAYIEAMPDARMTEDLDQDLWEIWCKETGKVYFIIYDTAKVVSIKPDPLGLAGFFPQPCPVQPIGGSGRRMPVCPYSVYQSLADELDHATRRINAIMDGLRVRGGVMEAAQEIARIAEADDNEMIVLADTQQLLVHGGLQTAIIWWPLEQSIAALNQLMVHREQIKATIYEVTGIGDILRGASDPRETATAQTLKGQWGSQRVKRLQRMIQSHVRDLFKLSAEIMVKHFSVDGLQRAAGVQLSPEAAMMIGQALDMYRIDVETDSTIKADTSRERGEMTEFIQGSAQYMQAMAPIVEQSPQSAPFVAEIYGAYARTFNLNKSAEDAIEQIIQQAAQQAQQPKQPKPEEQAKMKELGIREQEAQAKMMVMQQKAQIDMQRAQIEGQKAQAELYASRLDGMMKQQQMGMEVDRLKLDQWKAERDTMFKVEELKLEREQSRPVAIGM